jgi:hypothetical protein
MELPYWFQIFCIWISHYVRKNSDSVLLSHGKFNFVTLTKPILIYFRYWFKDPGNRPEDPNYSSSSGMKT